MSTSTKISDDVVFFLDQPDCLDNGLVLWKNPGVCQNVVRPWISVKNSMDYKRKHYCCEMTY